MNTANEKDRLYKIHTIEGYLSRLFLLEYEHGLLLLDGCSIGDVKRIEDFCVKSLNRHPTDIKLMAVSHMHPDHAGGACTLRGKHGIRIAGHRFLDRWYAGLTGWLQYRFDLTVTHHLVAKRRHRVTESLAFKRIIHPDFLVDEGDQLPFFPDWQVLCVPGHTRHDIALYHEQDDILFASDLIVDMNGAHNIPLPVVFPELMRRSYDKLAELNASTVLLPHGKTIRSPDTAQVFSDMKPLLDAPRTPVRKFVDLFSGLTPEYWWIKLRKVFSEPDENQT